MQAKRLRTISVIRAGKRNASKTGTRARHPRDGDDSASASERFCALQRAASRALCLVRKATVAVAYSTVFETLASKCY
eukprot:1193372-Prorocentrum_minimum.AAC.1